MKIRKLLSVQKAVEIIYDEKTAIKSTFERAPKGSLIVILCETVQGGLNLVTEFKEKETSVKILKKDIPNLN